MGVACARRLGRKCAPRARRLRRGQARRGRRRVHRRRFHRHRSAGRRVRPCVGRRTGRGGAWARDRCARSCTPPASPPRRRPASACSRSTCSAPTTCSTRSSTSSCRARSRSASPAWPDSMAEPARASSSTRSPRATTDGLMDALGDMDLSDFGATYSVAKRVNQLRVEQAAVAWGPRGGRVDQHQPRHHLDAHEHQELAEGAASRCRACSTSHRCRASAPPRTSPPRCSGWPARRRRSSAAATCASTAGSPPPSTGSWPRATEPLTPTRWWRAACSRCRARRG